jgi:hypothetical protein
MKERTGKGGQVREEKEMQRISNYELKKIRYRK